MSGRAIAMLISGTAGLMLIAVALLVPKNLRFAVGASGLVTGAAGATAAACWRKPQSQNVKDAIARTQQSLLDKAEQEIQGQLQPAPWTLNAVDIEASEQVSEPTHVTNLPVSELVSDVSDGHSLFNFDLDDNPWESTHSLTSEAEVASS